MPTLQMVGCHPRRQGGGVPELQYHAGIMEADDCQVTTVFSPTVIPPSAFDKPSIMKRYHRRRTCSQTSARRTPTMVTLHDIRFVESLTLLSSVEAFAAP